MSRFPKGSYCVCLRIMVARQMDCCWRGKLGEFGAEPLTGKKEKTPGRGNLSTRDFSKKFLLCVKGSLTLVPRISVDSWEIQRKAWCDGVSGKPGDWYPFVSARGNLTSNTKVMRKLRDTVQDIMDDLISSIFSLIK